MFRLFSFSLIFLLSACAHLPGRVGYHPPLPEDEITRVAEGYDVIIENASGKRYEGRELLVTPDSTWFYHTGDERRRGLPTSEIKKIGVQKRAGHGGKGFLLGFSTGAVAGYLVGYHTAKNNCTDPSEGCFAAPTGLLTGLGVGLLSGVVGQAIGEAFGETRWFDFKRIE